MCSDKFCLIVYLFTLFLVHKEQFEVSDTSVSKLMLDMCKL